MENYMQTNMDALLPLRDVVFKTLRQAILTGELAPGERLMEIHLAEKLGVSRTPIREAIRKLELEGLVTMVPRRGAQVSKISKKSMSDVLEVRLALDDLAAELACERITEDEIARLLEACNAFECAVATKDIRKIATADVAFHDIIFESTRNPRLSQLVNNLAEQMYRYRFEYIKDTQIHDNLVKEHREIYEAIKAKDKARARNLIHVHIENQEHAIIKQMQIEQK